jgi:hypothetical protein
MITHQVHSKFKVFTGSLAADHGLGALASQVEAFAADGKVAAKSIGVEYLESVQQLVITLGYRDDEPGYAVRLTTAPLGVIDKLEGDAIGVLEARMSEAADKVADVICHELYVTETHEFHMVFMSHAS